MATFVLVHGAWHGSWCWKRVRSALQKLGHEVFTPTLTGIGERSHLLAPDIDLHTHTMDVLNLIEWEELTDLVLCGHSYGGMVVTGVADRIPKRIRSLVYLDAFVPQHNQALVQFAPISDEQLIDGWKCKPIPAQTFGVNLADRAWVDRQCTVQSLACFRQPAQLTGEVAQIGRIAYAFASGWAGDQSPFYPFYQQAKSRGWAASELDCGHDAMLDQPEAVTALLLNSL
jgi:pimeloyl-ACP methyl ester carboxylesterase